ncbi:hypothetical protein G6F56_010441 [Rhizopus delemar]|uniref:PRA1 family protein n=1 Tax=Rhizopus stolonifer TaxID=4846 RepID=A0A367JLX1_RHIST|nr:hypothetical protein G6F56_010441 [Rhizopus delemar]RCH90895.1 hypothetical protein CU098_003708 [Rhizopus stolonifer]
MSAPLLSSVHNVEENTEHVPTNDRGTFWRRHFSSIKSFYDFFDINRISFSTSFETISHRWSSNLVYYSENYLMITLFLGVFAISSRVVLIFVFLWVTLGMYIISKLEEPIRLICCSISPPTICSMHGIFSLLLLIITGATKTIMWVTGAAGLFIFCHASIMEPRADEDEDYIDDVVV